MQAPDGGYTAAQILSFRRKLMSWYRSSARVLPWREMRDPYRIWVSEIMLQQTRVAAVIVHYERFMSLFPTVLALALAPESMVLAAWSGLGYYRRAHRLHKAARFLVDERGGQLPGNSHDLRTLPGIGEYTCAAIASIAFGESIAVLDGNVERVLLRLAGRTEDPSAAGRVLLRAQAAALVPNKRLSEQTNAAGDHNQAMMELGATLCLVRAPLCLHCPVLDFCKTRGEHATRPRGRQKSRAAAFLLSTRKRGISTEVLLERRSSALTLMPGMLELPPLPMDVLEGREPLLRLRHSITDTNYYIEVHAEKDAGEEPAGDLLRNAIPAALDALLWQPVSKLVELPLTGLARKILMRADLMAVTGPQSPARNSAQTRSLDRAGKIVQ